MIKWLLVRIILFGAILRFAGISYGLPLRLIADEPQFVLGAIQLVISKTLILPSTENFALLLAGSCKFHRGGHSCGSGADNQGFNFYFFHDSVLQT